MSIIQPGLFLFIQRFPVHKDALRPLYLHNESLGNICTISANVNQRWISIDCTTKSTRKGENHE